MLVKRKKIKTEAIRFLGWKNVDKIRGETTVIV